MKFLSTFVMSVAFVSTILASVACGTSPCDELDSRCDGCTGTGAVGCEFTVAFGDDDACQQMLDDPEFNQSCQ
jgi:hypothetical protein